MRQNILVVVLIKCFYKITQMKIYTKKTLIRNQQLIIPATFHTVFFEVASHVTLKGLASE